jgi:hypothetical protein
MRILLIIVMVLAMLVSAGMGMAIGNENLLTEEAKAAAELIDQLPGEAADKLSGYRTSGMGGFLVGISALVMVIVTFMKKTQVIQIVAGVTTLLAIVFIGMSPSFETGELGPAPPRTQAMVYGIAAIVVAICGFLAEKQRTKNA